MDHVTNARGKDVMVWLIIAEPLSCSYRLDYASLTHNFRKSPLIWDDPNMKPDSWGWKIRVLAFPRRAIELMKFGGSVSYTSACMAVGWRDREDAEDGEACGAEESRWRAHSLSSNGKRIKDCKPPSLGLYFRKQASGGRMETRTRQTADTPGEGVGKLSEPRSQRKQLSDLTGYTLYWSPICTYQQWVPNSRATHVDRLPVYPIKTESSQEPPRKISWIELLEQPAN
ncbi:hypothetical protein L210DRAFT_3507459 [Boletus edulis BED1]|uniref:Uncharacterized protein n=1 Tax=Boletus edulis BED1 TaxID=1328754 RepID=A0AAD4GA67_BOLED|nr:hypothetical protein L210DRAFT_3507459 [Boletus edulis BED1]